MTDRQEPTGPRSEGISYQQLLDTDPHPVPEVLRLESPRYLGSDDIPNDRFISRSWHELETERLWKRVWQMACREEQLPHVGSHIVYEVATLSYIVVRTEDGIKSYANACLHRGRQLKDHGGRCSEFRCPYHGFTWALDGSLAHVPARWDFDHVNDEDFSLPEAQVGTWGGFVFINPDPEAPSLADFMGGMPEQFERWKLEDRYVQGHVQKVIRANWKIVQEAFSESYHAPTTHPQTAPYLGDVNSQVDLWDNFSRVITPGGTPSPLLKWSPTEEEILRYMLDIRDDEEVYVSLAEEQTAREASAAAARERWRPVVGDMVDDWCDAEYIDNIDYTLFPNFHPWGAYNRIVYRFRPNGDNHREAIMDVYLLAPYEGDERPEAAATTYLGPDDEWTDATELGMLAKVFTQDSFNMPMVQRGLEAAVKPAVTLANYQESKVRWFHHRLAEFMEEG